MSFLLSIKKVENCQIKNFSDEKNNLLEENIEIANSLVRNELMDQNINFLKRLEKKINKKVKKIQL